jgi:riboflavin synthase
MFTGIIENLAKIISINKSKSNLDITLSSSLTSEFKIDQSISHNGICLTIINIDGNNYTVTAIEELIKLQSIVGKKEIL